MKAMILAAGKGTRVRPITYTLPKPMMPLVRKPVMESIIEHLRSYGVDQIVINTSHLAPMIENYFRDGERFGVHIAYSFEGRLVGGELKGEALGSAGGMKKVQDFSGFFDGPFIVLCGDALIDLDISKVLEFHKEKAAIATIVLKDVPRSEVSKYGVVQLDEDGRILRFQEKPSVEEAVSTTVNTGIYMFDPKVFDYIPSGVEYDIGGDLFPALIKAGKPVYGISLPFQWVDIGTIPDYWEASRLILTGKVRGYTMPGLKLRDGIYGGINLRVNLDNLEIKPPVYIGSSTHIEDGAMIYGPTIIGSSCVIESGAIVRECIVSDYTRISSVANLERKIVFGNKCIEPSGESLDIEEHDIGWVVDDVRKEMELTETHKMLMDLARELSGRE
jgi:mannose-1-phosphate guanylyltransferase